MKIRIERGDKPVDVQRSIVVYIGHDRFRISESKQGRMIINKASDGISDNINVHPCTANEIEIS